MKKTKNIALVLSVLIMSFLVGYIAFAWTDPEDSPPEDNVDAPLHVGSLGQSKIGGLILNTGGASTGLIVRHGNVGIGTASPGYRLDVRGNIYTSGDISAPNNVWGTCATLSWTCADSQTCPNGRFMVRVDRGTTRSLCGSGDNRWYQMRIECCQI